MRTVFLLPLFFVSLLAWPTKGTSASSDNEDLLLRSRQRLDVCDYEQALRLAREALELKKKCCTADTASLAACLQLLAEIRAASGRPAQAERLYAQVIASLRAGCGSDCEDGCFHYASALINYARFLASRGRFERAEQTYLKAASTLEGCFQFSLESREVLKELFGLHRSRGDYGRAIVVLKRIFWKTQPASRALAEVYLDFADIYSRQKDWKNALDSCRRALGIIEKIYGPSHTAVAQVVAQLAELNMKLGRYGFAALLYDRLIRIRMEELDIPSLAQTWRRWARLDRMMGRFTEAEALESRAARVLELKH